MINRYLMALLLFLPVLFQVAPAWAAFPQVRSSAACAPSVNCTDTGSTSIVITLPSPIEPGDLILVFVAVDLTGSQDWSSATGFSEIYDENTANGCNLGVGHKIADGTEDGTTITVTGSGANKAAHQAYAISGHNPAIAPQAAAEATGTSGNPNPPSLTPTGGAKPYLWFAAACIDGSVDITDDPADYANFVFNETTAGNGTGLGVARRELNAISENPGAFTAASDDWNATTVAVHPLPADDVQVIEAH